MVHLVTLFLLHVLRESYGFIFLPIVNIIILIDFKMLNQHCICRINAILSWFVIILYIVGFGLFLSNFLGVMYVYIYSYYIYINIAI